MRRRYALSLMILLSLTLGAAQQSERSAALERAIGDQNRLVEEREQALAEIRANLGTLSAELETRLGERERVSQELAAIQNERAGLVTDIALLRSEIDRVESEIRTLDSQLADLKVRVKGLLVNLYRQRSSRFAEVLGQAESFHDLRVKNYYLSLLSEQDVNLIEALDQAAAEFFMLQEQNRANLGNLNSKVESLNASELALTRTQETLSQLVAGLEADYEGQLALQQLRLEEQAELERTLNALVRDLDNERERLAEEVRRREEAERSVSERSETLAETQALPPLASDYVYPLNRPRLSRAFGESGFPSVWLQANEPWAAVHAVQPGVVVEAGPLSANQGYIVVIQHEGGLFTTYVNLQAVPLVSVDDQVSQNQVVGYLGGGALIPADVLEFYTGWFDGDRINYTDPSSLLGF